MFKNIFLLVSLLLAAGLSAAENGKPNDTILNYKNHINRDGTYNFDIAQSSGLGFKEVGSGGHYAKGAYKYISPEGQEISVAYTADETGFHPESESIPTPPPIPAYILKAIKYINEKPTIEEIFDRSRRAKLI